MLSKSITYAAIGIIAATLLAAALLHEPAQPTQHAGSHSPAAFSLFAAGSNAQQSSEQDSSQAKPAALEALAVLDGTQADGGWCVGANGKLSPQLALRRRFDYYLNALGLTSLDPLSARVQSDAQAAVGTAAAEQIMALWRAYLKLQQHSYSTQVNLADRNTWGAALAERSRVRRELLPLVWAEAFYRDEEDAFRAFMNADSTAKTAAVTDAAWRASLNPQAHARVSAADAVWADWEQRLAAARTEQARLQAAPELAAPQRSAQFERYLADHFDAQEMPRVHALLGNAPATPTGSGP